MKKFLFFLFIYVNTYSQEHNFILENYEVRWEKTYDAPNNTKEELINKIKTFCISSMSLNNLQINEDRLTFVVNDDSINLKKLGRKSLTSPIVCQLLYDYLVVIDIKDNKYRVILKDLKIDDKKNNGMLSSTFNEQFTKKRGTELVNTKNAKDAINLFDQHFSDKFSIQNIEVKKSDW